MIISLQLKDKAVFIVGDSIEAIKRANQFTSEGAKVTLYGSPSPELQILLDSGIVQRGRTPRRHELRKAFLVVATDGNPGINKRLHDSQPRMKFLLNTLDVKSSCNFYHLATRKLHDSIEIAVSTNGTSPAFASRYADRIRDSFTDKDKEVYDAFVETRAGLRNLGISGFDFDWPGLEKSVRSKARQESRMEISAKASSAANK